MRGDLEVFFPLRFFAFILFLWVFAFFLFFLSRSVSTALIRALLGAWGGRKECAQKCKKWERCCEEERERRLDERGLK